MNLFKKKISDKILVASINGGQCRIQQFINQSGNLKQANITVFDYANLTELTLYFGQWCKSNQIKNTPCRWLLSHELYQSYLTDPPNVLEKEMTEALKWQIKDQLDLPVNEVLISHYKPNHPDPDNKQITAICVEKKLIEGLINVTQTTGLVLDSIEIEELAIGKALSSYLEPDKIVGYVGENNSGLVFNFYQNNQLVFSRYKKGLFIPSSATNEFSLESDSQDLEDAFLLETQRTLDYVISQIFRKPIDLILLQQNNQRRDTLAETINQIVETKVLLVKPNVEALFNGQPNSEADGDSKPAEQKTIMTTLAEAGCALGIAV